MKNRANTIFSVATVLGTFALASESAHAYIDPGTGTLLIQWIFGAVFAGLAVMKIYWAQAKMFITTRFGNAEPIENIDSGESEETR